MNSLKFHDHFKNSLIISADEGFTSPVISSLEKAKELNAKKRAVFFSVQGFKDNRRTIENLININAWAIDLDKGTKQEQKERLSKTPVMPSAVIETRRGYHAYWFSTGATVERFKDIMETLVETFSADKNAKDLARVLRMPDCLQWKEEPPFLVKTVFYNGKVYHQDEMLLFFNILDKKKINNYVQTPKIYGSKKFFQTRNKVDFDSLDNRAILEMISGTHHVDGDTFEFKRNSNGTEQIWVNGKSTACWLDANGKIGSHDKAGPGIFQWLNWYYRDNKQTMQALRSLNVFN